MTKARASILAFLAAVAGLVYLVFVKHLFADHPILIGVQAAAVGLMLWARVTFGRRSFHAAADPSEGELVTHGPYRWWRHPIYASILYFTWAGQVAEPRFDAIAAALVVTAGLVVRMLLEEQLLRTAHPAYSEFCKRTKRFVPFVL